MLIERPDVMVWGGGSGGVAAAIQAARSGACSLLLTPGPWLGGMVSAAGVSAPDGHELSSWQTGLWGALLRELESREPSGLDHNWVSCFGFQPERAEQILQDWVRRESRLEWKSNCTLRAAVRNGDRIQQVDVTHGSTTYRVEASVFIDGSDLGDLLALSQSPFRWGWEAQERWDEPSAPLQNDLDSDPFFQLQPVQSPTWVVMGQLNEGLAAPFQARTPAPPFEICTEAFGFEKTITYGRLPGGLVMINWPLDGNDWHDGLDRAISDDPRKREELGHSMRNHSRSFLAALIECGEGWLEAGNAFPGDDPSLALMPYWRESRRLIGRRTVSERDLLPLTTGASHGPIPVDQDGRCTSIAIGTYANDHHYPGKDWPLAPKSIRWGGRWTGTPFCIPFESLFSDAVPNLLMADKGFSVSHIANGATRLQPLILNIGQAAGLAAAMAVCNSCLPVDLPVQHLQQKLLNDPIAPAAVMPIWDWPIWHPNWRTIQEQLLSVPELLDDGGLDDLASLPGNATYPSRDQAPATRNEILLNGDLVPAADASWRIHTAGQEWPLITLEPAVHRWMQTQDRRKNVRLRGVLNPWGPWFRVTGVPHDQSRR